MSRIGLISCVAQKRNIASAAEDLYLSDLFMKSRAFVRRTCDCWYILSAKHGLLDPSESIEPYNQTLNTMRQADRRAWASRVHAQLQAVLHPGDKITILAGQRYREFLLPALKADGFSVSIPLERLRIGLQLQWLKQQPL